MARITSEFEREALRKQFITLRSAHKLPTRRKLPTTFDTKVTYKTNDKSREVPINPEYLPSGFPLLKPPAFFDGRPVIDGVEIVGLHSVINPSLEQYLRKWNSATFPYCGILWV
jgi:hypothetical protein